MISEESSVRDKEAHEEMRLTETSIYGLAT